MAVWKQAALAEIARAAGAAYGISLFDLQKAFERVPWDLLAAAAHECGHNLYLIRLSIAVYALLKAITVDGACSSFVKALRGMTAGSTFANIELRVFLFRSLDIVARTARITSLTVFVDDVAIEAVGTRAMVLRQWIATMKVLIECFLALRLEFSDTKNTIIAYPQSIAYAAVAAIPEVALHACLTGKSLGAGI